ncbi:SAM-dependent methyltransferase [Actinocatenispora thailandica]|uniref:SAM-dependent methyltransferase n=1 Tax=Actinocatenispora thailandica TaxID=227318 RepID=UPI001EF30AB6|nr:SAM-dependent methyltransferase [Actinocatenispora thailandica]
MAETNDRVRWRTAMRAALYGDGGFFTAGAGPAGHFRTSAQTVPMARAIGTLLVRLDAALGRPDPLDVVDLGAGGGELLTALAAGTPAQLAGRVRYTGVELAGRPRLLPSTVEWRTELPDRVTGLLLATEWLDNVPVDVAEVDADGVPRLVLVDPSTGAETLGPAVTGRDAGWLDRYWPLTEPGARAEIGHPRDDAWADATARLVRGVAVAVDYGHRAGARPYPGTLTGYRHGRQVPPVPDGSTDLTAHVAWDSLLVPGDALVRQREALRALGVTGERPPLADAAADPAGYLRALAAATHAAEVTDPTGLGGHDWLLHAAGIGLPTLAIPG